eukprot:scaffold1535_cov382-Prasinococcus_capsulatus_cf.AAC.48
MQQGGAAHLRLEVMVPLHELRDLLLALLGKVIVAAEHGLLLLLFVEGDVSLKVLQVQLRCVHPGSHPVALQRHSARLLLRAAKHTPPAQELFATAARWPLPCELRELAVAFALCCAAWAADEAATGRRAMTTTGTDAPARAVPAAAGWQGGAAGARARGIHSGGGVTTTAREAGAGAGSGARASVASLVPHTPAAPQCRPLHWRRAARLQRGPSVRTATGRGAAVLRILHRRRRASGHRVVARLPAEHKRVAWDAPALRGAVQ